MVCLEYLEPHIRMLWSAQFVTLSFAQPTPEDGKVLAFTREIRLSLLPAKVVVKPEWLTLVEVALQQAAEMEALLVRLDPRHPAYPKIPQELTGYPYPRRP